MAAAANANTATYPSLLSPSNLHTSNPLSLCTSSLSLVPNFCWGNGDGGRHFVQWIASFQSFGALSLMERASLERMWTPNRVV